MSGTHPPGETSPREETGGATSIATVVLALLTALGAAAFEKMKPGVRIVNCARGELIDGLALTAAMQSGKKFGMQTMNDALYQLYTSREVAQEECERVSHDPKEFLRMIGVTPMEDQEMTTTDRAPERAVAARTLNLRKVYGEGEAAVNALDGVDIEFYTAEFTAVMGASGAVAILNRRPTAFAVPKYRRAIRSEMTATGGASARSRASSSARSAS